ncbi:helix-turn-helix domain-containing protein [Flavobacterium sp.]|uniref:helix-turn-helix domain-containing protein n=1 Tax=Flavobacterium sp. TaxID=239 RepID=UPI0026390D67|nr:helix-turn-helix domain-containing protein [Flavobacterium sp.]MDG2432877.1 helix-turn-helix domain-containing protein [Flavobacterium sp.]
MNIDRMEFIAWMERIMDRFDILSEHITDIQKKRNNIDGEELLDNQDLLQMLKISNRSLQRYRSTGKLPYYTISGKIYYKLSDVHQFIRDSFNAPRQNLKPTNDNTCQLKSLCE